MKKLMWLVIAVVVIGGLVAYSNKDKEVADDSKQDEETMENEDSSAMLVGENAIFVASQRPGNNIVTGIVYLENKGYVVVHKSEDGKPGEVVGTSTLLEAGSNSNVKIDLSEDIEDGQELFAMLHIDDGDGEYDEEKDGPVTDGQGNVIMMKFMVDVNATPEVEASL